MTSPVAFLREVRDELSKVVWPSRNEVIRLTMAVIISSAVIGVFLGAVDYLLVEATQFFLR